MGLTSVLEHPQTLAASLEGHANLPFTGYCDEAGCKANSASGRLNKRLHQYVPENCVIHSFRHSSRDRLRAVEFPSDIVDAIGGWKTSGIGHGYGNG